MTMNSSGVPASPASARSNRKWGRAARLLALPLFLGLLGACASDDPTNTDVAAETEVSTTTPTTPDGSATEDVPDEWSAVEAAASEEGEVNLYTVVSVPLLDELTAAFSEVYPDIQLNTVRLQSAEMADRVENSLASGGGEIDVFAPAGTTYAQDLADRGVIDTSVTVPEAEAYGEEWFANGIGTTFPGVEQLCYNTDLVQDDLDWEDLTDPAWKGEMIAVWPSTPYNVNMWLAMRDRFGDDYIAQLAEQDIEFTQSGNTASEIVAAGEKSIVIWCHAHNEKTLQEAGAPFAKVDSPFASGWRNTVATFADAPNPNAAKVLLNFILSERGQLALTGDEKNVSAYPGGLPGAIELPAEFTILAENFSDGTEDEIREMRALLGLPEEVDLG